MNNVNINEKGRSMVEMLGVLAIIGVLSAGGLAGYSKAMFKHKLNTTIDQITMIVTNIRTLYGTQGNYGGLSNAMAAQAGIVPASMYTGNASAVAASAGGLTNPFKGGVVITTADAVNGGGASETANTAFVITYSGLPSEACVQIATSDFGTGAGSGFLGSDAGADAALSGAYAGSGTEGKPLSLGGNDGAIAKCNQPGTTNSVTLKFY